MSTSSSDEILAALTEKFGSDHAVLINGLTNRVIQLHSQWYLFNYLYGTDQRRLDLLNQASGSASRIIGNALWDNVLVSIRRLTDRKVTRTKTGNERNFTLHWLVDVATEHADADLTADWERLNAACSASKNYATKNVAHLDYDHAIGSGEFKINRKQTVEAVNAIGTFLNLFHETTSNKNMSFRVITRKPDHQSFLRILQLGLNKHADMQAAAKDNWRLRSTEEFQFPEWMIDTQN